MWQSVKNWLAQTTTRYGLAGLVQIWATYLAADVVGTSDMRVLLSSAITGSAPCLIAIIYPEGKKNPPQAGA